MTLVASGMILALAVSVAEISIAYGRRGLFSSLSFIMAMLSAAFALGGHL